MSSKQTVVILGASSNVERYSYKALSLLLEKGHHVIPVHPKETTINGITVQPIISDIDEPIDTLSIYLSPKLSEPLIHDMLALKPKRVILNPGTESEKIEETMKKNHIEVVKGCTIVMLKTGQF